MEHIIPLLFLIVSVLLGIVTYLFFRVSQLEHTLSVHSNILNKNADAMIKFAELTKELHCKYELVATATSVLIDDVSELKGANSPKEAKKENKKNNSSKAQAEKQAE